MAATGRRAASSNNRAQPGHLYTLTFSYGNFQTNGAATGNQTVQVQVSDVGTGQSLSDMTIVDRTGTANLDHVTSNYSAQFVALGSDTTLFFRDLSPLTESTDGIIDNVAVIPEPSTYLLLMLGLPVLWARWRSRT